MLIPFAGVAAIACWSGTVEAEGLITLVAHGAQDVYLTAGNDSDVEGASAIAPDVGREVIVDDTGVTIIDSAIGGEILPQP